MKSKTTHSISKIRNSFLGFGWNTSLYSSMTGSISNQIKTDAQNLNQK